MAILVILTYAAVYFAFETDNGKRPSKLNGSMYTYFVINGVLLLFTYPLLFPGEKTFGFNFECYFGGNCPTSQQFAVAHVGNRTRHIPAFHGGRNLAAEAANRIGANSQLVRTGALYHDIGKMENPAFFTENQSGGVTNPHKNLGYEQSAQVVIGHNGRIETTRKANNLPKSHQLEGYFITSRSRTTVEAEKNENFYISRKNEHLKKQDL